MTKPTEPQGPKLAPDADSEDVPSHGRGEASTAEATKVKDAAGRGTDGGAEGGAHQGAGEGSSKGANQGTGKGPNKSASNGTDYVGRESSETASPQAKSRSGPEAGDADSDSASSAGSATTVKPLGEREERKDASAKQDEAETGEKAASAAEAETDGGQEPAQSADDPRRGADQPRVAAESERPPATLPPPWKRAPQADTAKPEPSAQGGDDDSGGESDRDTGSAPEEHKRTEEDQPAEASRPEPGPRVARFDELAGQEREEDSDPLSEAQTVFLDQPTTVLRPQFGAGASGGESQPGLGQPPGGFPASWPRSRRPRQASLQLKRLDPWSVLKIALVLAAVLYLIWLVAVGLLYGVLDGIGVWDRLNGQYADLVAEQGGERLISVGRVFGVAAVVGAVNSLLVAVSLSLGAFVYNVSADLVGGIELTLSERD